MKDYDILPKEGMIKLAIMQPYFFSYLGYWQMLKAVDTFVIYDDVNYIKNGWINRNNILSNGEGHLFTLSLDKASPFKKINETFILSGAREKVLSFIRNSYLKAPFFKMVFPLIDKIVNYPENNIALFLENQFKVVFNYLGIGTKILLSSRDVEKDLKLSAQDKVLQICKGLKAAQYINAIGGQELYNKEIFAKNGIQLNFIKMNPVSYHQFGNDFVSNLSIIDVMMFNSSEEINEMLDNYELL